MMLLFSVIYSVFAISYVSSQGEMPFALFIILLVCLVGLICAILMYRDDSVYHELMRQVKKLGDPDDVAKILESLPKAASVKGDLCFNDKLIFYTYGHTAFIVPSSDIIGFSKHKFTNRGCVSHYVYAHTRLCHVSIEVCSKEASEVLYETMQELYRGSIEKNNNKKLQAPNIK